MQLKNYLFWILCGLLSVGAGFVSSQNIADGATLQATEDGCGEEEKDGDDDEEQADSMPNAILKGNA